MEHAVKREVELEEELKAYRMRCKELEEKSRKAEQESRALLIELEKSVNKDCVSFGVKLGVLEIDKSSIEDALKKFKSLCDCLQEIVLLSSSPSPDKEIRDVRSTGPPCICMPHDSLAKVMEEVNITSETELQHVTHVRRQLEFRQEGSTNKKMAGSKTVSGRPVSGGVIEIVDSDDDTSEMNIVAVATPNIRDKGKVPISVDNSLKGVLKDEKEMTSDNCLKRINSNQRGEENWSSFKESYELASTPKRKRASNIITSDSEGDDDEDKIPISKLKLKKLQDLIHEPMGSTVNQCSMAPIVSSGDCNVEESFTPSKRRLVTLRECEERKNGLETISHGHLGKNESDSEYEVTAGPVAENARDHEGEDVGSDTEGESLDGFIVDGSDGLDGEDTSADSEDVGDDDLSFDQVISMIRRNRINKSEWTFEADMLSSFQKDPELCMKAVCALYRLQTADEKSIKGSFYLNNQGFSKFDAVRGTNLAEFLLDGDSQGELKKTVQELEKHMPGGLDECRSLASHYSKQLFKIYQNKEDPYFP